MKLLLPDRTFNRGLQAVFQPQAVFGAQSRSHRVCLNSENDLFTIDKEAHFPRIKRSYPDETKAKNESCCDARDDLLAEPKQTHDDPWWLRATVRDNGMNRQNARCRAAFMFGSPCLTLEMSHADVILCVIGKSSLSATTLLTWSTV